jgi:hypothetical protein
MGGINFNVCGRLKKHRSTKDRLFTRILEEAGKTGGQVSFASATFHLVQTPVLDVRINK